MKDMFQHLRKRAALESLRQRIVTAGLFIAATAIGAVGLSGNAIAHMGHMGHGVVQGLRAGDCVNPYWAFEKDMSRRDKIDQARRGGPHISARATIMARDRCGELTTLLKGDNGFVCIPNADAVPVANPVCLDPTAFEWYKAAYFGANPKPSTLGVAYMALGGGHWEINGQVVFDPTGAKLVRDPPHWMLLWEFDTKKSGLPSYPNTGDIVVVFDGTPFAIMLIPWNTLCSSERHFVGCLDSLAERGLPN